MDEKYKIDFSVLQRNMGEIAEKKMLSQFYSSKVAKLLLGAFIKETQELYDSIIQLLEKRTLYEAEGVNLDALGRIVGQPREYINYNNAFYFKPDTAGVAADQGHWWVTNAPISGYETAIDPVYKDKILLKIKKNFNKFSSIPELEDIISEVIDFPVRITREKPFDLVLYVSSAIPQTQLEYLKDFTNNIIVDNSFEIPYSTTIRIDNSFFYVPLIPFAPDRVENASDIGMAALKGETNYG